MKVAILLSLLSLSALAAPTGAKVIATSTGDCEQKVQVTGKEGDKFVTATVDGKEMKLNSKDGSVYKTESMNDVEFTNGTMTYVHPSTVNGNPPKLLGSDKLRCKLSLK